MTRSKGASPAVPSLQGSTLGFAERPSVCCTLALSNESIGEGWSGFGPLLSRPPFVLAPLAHPRVAFPIVGRPASSADGTFTSILLFIA